MWDLPRPGLEPVSPALAGRFSTTAPPGKPPYWFLKIIYSDRNGLLREKYIYLEIASIEKILFSELILRNLSSQTGSVPLSLVSKSRVCWKIIGAQREDPHRSLSSGHVLAVARHWEHFFRTNHTTTDSENKFSSFCIFPSSVCFWMIF